MTRQRRRRRWSPTLPPDVAKGPPAFADQTVLLVEDEILIRTVIADYLRQCGFKVIEAAGADEAIMVLKRPDIAVSIVFSDVEMPGEMDGFGLSQWVRSNRPGLAVLLAGTLTKTADTAAKLCEKGPALKKPYEPHIAVQHIKRLLAARSDESPT
ncbi:MAG TPA: response regulator [Xanthobacteraceae bacterium]